MESVRKWIGSRHAAIFQSAAQAACPLPGKPRWLSNGDIWVENGPKVTAVSTNAAMAMKPDGDRSQSLCSKT